MTKCCDYTAGMLRETVTLKSQTKTSIGGGATEIAYTTYATVRGMLKALSGGERLYASRLDATTRNRLVIRYRSDVTESDQVVVRGKAYQIRFIDNVEFRDKWLVLDLDGGVAQ